MQVKGAVLVHCKLLDALPTKLQRVKIEDAVIDLGAELGLLFSAPMKIWHSPHEQYATYSVVFGTPIFFFYEGRENDQLKITYGKLY